MATFLNMFEVSLTPRGFPKQDFTSLIVLPEKPTMLHYKRINKIVSEE